MSDWHSEDTKPYDQWLAELEAKHGKNIARVIANAPPPRPKKHFTAKTSQGLRTVAVRGNPENRDAPPQAMDFRHHRARIESGR